MKMSYSVNPSFTFSIVYQLTVTTTASTKAPSTTPAIFPPFPTTHPHVGNHSETIYKLDRNLRLTRWIQDEHLVADLGNGQNYKISTHHTQPVCALITQCNPHIIHPAGDYANIMQ